MSPYSFGLIFVDKESSLVHEEKYFTKNGDAGQKLIKSLLDEEEKLLAYAMRTKPMELTEMDEIKIQQQTECHICEQPFEPNDEKHRDHDHFNGRFRGMAHSICNKNLRRAHFINVYMHNGSR